jgi:hypothetical protein
MSAANPARHLDRQMAGLAREKRTLQGRPLAEARRELGQQTLVDNEATGVSSLVYSSSECAPIDIK